MDVSIVIVNYNTFDLTCQCIQSIEVIAPVVKYEIILVDNASTEIDPVNFKFRFPTITLIQNQENLGFAAGNNKGIEVARGNYVLLLNSDAKLLNDAISVCHEFISKTDGVAAVTCKLIYPDGTLQHNCQRFPSIKYYLLEFLRIQKILGRDKGGEYLMGPFFNYDRIAFPDWIWGTFFMFRRSILDSFPGKKLPDTFFMYGEDMEWCMEFRMRKAKVAFVPAGHVMHFMGQSKGDKTGMMHANVSKFMKRYYPAWQIPIITFMRKVLEN